MADLEVQSISKAFGDVLVLDDVSLRVPDGGFTILLGPSGCGKSTLLRIIAGLEHQTSGDILVDGATIGHLSPGDRDVAMVFQSYALYPHLSARDNMAFGLKMRKEPKHVIEARIKEAAELLDIAELLDRKPRELSGGQRQRVAMGRAIVRKPKLFLFDEPLSNLDARLRTSTRIELKKLHQRLGATMIYVTHDQVEAMTLGDTIVIMDHGKVRQIGAPADIYNRPADPFVAGFIGNPGMNLLEGELVTQAQARSFRSGAFTLELPATTGPSSPEPRPPVVMGIRPEDMLIEATGVACSKITGKVEVVEDLGADLIVHVAIGDRRIVARVSERPRLSSIEEGSGLTLYCPHDRLHLFVNNRRVEWR